MSLSKIRGPTVTLSQINNLKAGSKKLIPLLTSASKLSGNARHKIYSRTRGMNFDQIRVYHQGDDVRHIDWRVTSRSRRTHTKVFIDDPECPLLLLVDQRNRMYFGSRLKYKSVLAAEISAILTWAAHLSGDPVGSRILWKGKLHDVKCERSTRPALKIAKQLAICNDGHAIVDDRVGVPISLASALRNLAHLAPTGSNLFLISDFHDLNEECAPALQDLSTRFTVYALIVADLLESRLPKEKMLPVTNGKSFRLINSEDAHQIGIYENGFLSKQKEISELLRRYNIRNRICWTHEDPLIMLPQFLKSS